MGLFPVHEDCAMYPMIAAACTICSSGYEAPARLVKQGGSALPCCGSWMWRAYLMTYRPDADPAARQKARLLDIFECLFCGRFQYAVSGEPVRDEELIAVLRGFPYG